MGILAQPSRWLRDAAIAAIVVASLVATGSTAAQQPAQHPAALRTPTVRAPSENEAPQSTTATYGDWVVQCQTRSGTPPEKFCDMAQVTQVQGRNIPFSRVVIVRPAKTQPLRLVVQVPVNVSLATPVHIQTSDADQGLSKPFSRCLPSGCFAAFEINAETLKKLRAASANGKLSFADASGRDVVVPLSFKGFSQAFDALQKE